MKIYLTEVKMFNKEYAGGWAKVAGPRVEATSEAEAQQILYSSGLIGVNVVGALVE